MATEAGVEPAIQESKSRALPFGYSAMIGKKDAFLIHSAKCELSPIRLATHGRPVAAMAAAAPVGSGGDGVIRTHGREFPYDGLANRCHKPLGHVSRNGVQFSALNVCCPAPWRPLIMDLSALLSVVSQLLSVCVPSGSALLSATTEGSDPAH